MTRDVAGGRRPHPFGRRRFLPTAVGAAVALVALTACSGGSTRDATPLPSAAMSAAGSASGTPSPPRATPDSAAAATTPAPPAPSTAPGTTGGGVDATVSLTPVTTLPAVPVGSTAGSAGISVRIDRVESVKGEAQGPGQVAGPAVRFTVVIRNGTSTPLSLDTVTVDVRDATGTPALSLAGPGVQQFSGTAPAGASVTGLYVFGLAPAARSDVTVLITYDGAAPTVVFRGAV